MAFLLLAALLDLPDGPKPPARGDWPYVVPAPGGAFEYPPLRALALSREKPDDVVEKATYRGHRRRYAQLRYGSPSSVRVTVVIDDLAPGKADLYVDANRNRRIEPVERFVPAPDGRTWRLPLEVAVVEGEITRTEERVAVFQLGSTGLTLSHAAAGYLDGFVTHAGRKHAARRTDGDGNGRFTDSQDRLWIDLDDNGQWDPVKEQFPYASVLAIAGARFAVRSDEYGRRLNLEVVEGTGHTSLVFKRPGATVLELNATLEGRDGSAVGLHGVEPVTIPVGEYRMTTVTLTLADPAGGPSWSYVFSDNSRRGEMIWYKVAKDARLTIDPIGRLEMAVNLEGDGPRGPDSVLRVNPVLYTGDGLLIVTAYRGSPTVTASDDGPGADVSLRDGEGRALSTSRSGFA
jgi:hypothetical protein